MMRRANGVTCRMRPAAPAFPVRLRSSEFLDLSQLFGMMAAVREVKGTPLLCCQRTQDWVLGNGIARRKLRLTFGDDAVHAIEIFHHVLNHLLCWGTPRHGTLRGFAASRNIAKPGHGNSLPTFLASTTGGTRPPFRYSLLQVLDRAHVCKIQVFENLGRALLPFSSARQFVNSHFINCRGKHVAKLGQFGMHAL